MLLRGITEMPSYTYHDEMEDWIEEAKRILALLQEADKARESSEQPKNQKQDRG